MDDIPINNLPNFSSTINQLKNTFLSLFNTTPDFYVRVPGRVNLIGEHIDYCGYGVCPMALQQDIIIAANATSNDTLRLHNLDKNYPNHELNLNNIMITTGESTSSWHQYFLCGVRGILDILPKGVHVKGMNVVVFGTIPKCAGLSSSSALVSAAALTTAYLNNFTLSKEKIANLCAECERYIGTQGGGMDQAIAFLATEGCAKYIEFSPLRSKDITLPKGAVFVIAHSLTKLNKAATADYNCRVAECRIAAKLIAKKQNQRWIEIKTLKDVQDVLGCNLLEMINLVEQTLHASPYTKDEIIKELETTYDYFESVLLTSNTKNMETFKLCQRALHVFGEAHRTETFKMLCSKENGKKAGDCNDDNLLETLGKLMTESHKSLRDLYECSHPQLDRLVDLSGEFSLGCRLTGAGWGGCVVALLHSENVDKHINYLKENFYSKFEQIDNINNVIFATTPHAGACIYKC